MNSRMASFFVVVVLALNIILQVNGQPTAQVCNNEDSSISGEVFSVEAIRHLSEQINSMREQMKAMEDTVKTSLEAVDRRLQEQDIYTKQVPSIHALLNASNQQIKYLNASVQQIKAQQDTVKTSLQAVDRRSQEQMKSQHDIVLRGLEAVGRRLNDLDNSIKSQIQNSWKQSVGLPVQLEIGIGTGGASVVLPIVNDWIVLMHRFDGSLDFNIHWIEYKNGFGDLRRGEFWFGNEKVHRLTNRVGVTYTLRVEVQVPATGQWFYAEYATFSLDSERSKYALRLSRYSGNAGDALASTSLSATERHNGRSFSTSDADNDRAGAHCAQQYRGGWWFDACFTSCLTCPYQDLFKWHYVGGWQTSGLLRAARMMIKSI